MNCAFSIIGLGINNRNFNFIAIGAIAPLDTPVAYCINKLQQTWIGNVNMTSYCDITNSAHPRTMTTIRHCSIVFETWSILDSTNVSRPHDCIIVESSLPWLKLCAIGFVVWEFSLSKVNCMKMAYSTVFLYKTCVLIDFMQTFVCFLLSSFRFSTCLL